MFEIRKLGDRGEGCVAVRQISQGEVIYREKAVIPRSVHFQELKCFIIQNQYQDDPILLEAKKLESEIESVFQLFENLPGSTKPLYLELSHHPSHNQDYVRKVAEHCFQSRRENEEFSTELMERVFNIYRTNAFNNGLFLMLAKFNHSCYHNAEIIVNEDDSRDVIAIDLIEKGEEIVHNYLNNVYEATSRKKEIFERWNFYCNCCFCDTHANLKNMIYLSEIEKKICEKAISIEQLMENISILNLRSDVRSIRIDKTLNILDLAFNYVCIFGYNKSHLAMAKNLASLGTYLSHILYGKKNPRHLKWSHREKYSVLYFLERKIVSILKGTFSVLTHIIILSNFVHVNVTPFLLLIVTLVISHKI